MSDDEAVQSLTTIGARRPLAVHCARTTKSACLAGAAFGAVGMLLLALLPFAAFSTFNHAYNPLRPKSAIVKEAEAQGITE